jgi:hypothetical protein
MLLFLRFDIAVLVGCKTYICDVRREMFQWKGSQFNCQSDADSEITYLLLWAQLLQYPNFSHAKKAEAPKAQHVKGCEPPFPLMLANAP